MIVVDTSVWVDYFRGRNRSLVVQMDELLDADAVALTTPGRLELLAGAPGAEVARLRRITQALVTYEPTSATWSLAEEWISRAATKGHRFGVIDLLIAALAHEHAAPLWSLDGDFARMAKLGLVRSYR